MLQVQCYPCGEAETCTHLDLCVNTAHLTFHCQTPLALLHDVNVRETRHVINDFTCIFFLFQFALCIFNYNIGFFSFIMGELDIIMFKR